jgi:hypothetical protein
LKITELQLVALVKDLDNWTETDVQVTVGNQQDTVRLVSADELYKGNPSGTVSYQDVEPGQWTITVPTTSVGAPSDWIDDLAVLVTYEINVAAG